ncbi:MAG: hypothetical protein ACREJB_09600, partial [Planctomycetaceae bacterium]
RILCFLCSLKSQIKAHRRRAVGSGGPSARGDGAFEHTKATGGLPELAEIAEFVVKRDRMELTQTAEGVSYTQLRRLISS